MGSIINTARSIYAKNEKASVIGSLAKSAKVHMQAAVHPSNLVGSLFGHGSFVHTKSQRILGKPKYLPGGTKNYAKEGVKGLGGRSTSYTSGQGSSSGIAAGSDVTNKQLSRIEDHTGKTVDILSDMVTLDKKASARADVKADFDKENAAEQNRLFETLGDRLSKLSVAPGGATSKTGGGSFWSTFGGTFTGVAVERFAAAFLTGLSRLAGMALFAIGKSAAFAGALGSFAVRIGGLGLALIGLVVNGAYEGFKKYQETGNMRDAIPALLSGMTAGLLSPQFIVDNFLDPMASAIQYCVDAISNAVKNASAWFMSFWKDPAAITLPLQPRPRPPGAPRRPNEKTTRQNIHRPPAPGPATTAPAGAAKQSKSFWDMLTDTSPGTLWNFLGTPWRSTSTKSTASPAPTAKAAATASPFVSGGMGFGNNGVPPEGMNLLNTIAGSEAGGYGYNAIVGSGQYGAPASFSDMSDHPRIRGVGLLHAGSKWLHVSDPSARIGSTAAGRYQFTATTWDNLHRLHPELPRDFSPASQDIAAWTLAKDDYARNTGGSSLEMDLGDPSKVSQIARALSGTWSSLPGGLEPNSMTTSFASRLGGGGATASMAATAPRNNVPAATAAASAAQQQAATTTQDATLGPESYVNNVINNIRSRDEGTADKGLIPSGQGESVDDIISKILVAMGVVTAT